MLTSEFSIELTIELTSENFWQMSDIERRAAEGLTFKRNYDTVHAQSQMLQERVNSLEKDLLESQQQVASGAALMEAAYHKDEVARITQELIELQTQTETQKSVVMEEFNETKRQLEQELDKNKQLEYFQQQCERISGIDMSKLCSAQELTLTQQMLLGERARSTSAKTLAVWIARFKRKKGMLRARQWVVSGRARRYKSHTLHFMQLAARRGKKLNQILHAFQWRKSRSMQFSIILEWAKAVKVVRAFNAAANALLERSDIALARDVLIHWQQVVENEKVAEEHGKSAGMRRSLIAAKAAMSTLEAEDFQSLLPAMAPDVYAGHDTTRNVWNVIVEQVQFYSMHVLHLSGRLS